MKRTLLIIGIIFLLIIVVILSCNKQIMESEFVDDKSVPVTQTDQNIE